MSAWPGWIEQYGGTGETDNTLLRSSLQYNNGLTIVNKTSRKFYFDLLRKRWQRCLEPEEQCEELPIRSHSIQNSGVLDLLSHDGHVVMPLRCHDKGGHPIIEYKRIGRNQASTFTGLCSKHDTNVLRPIESGHLDLSDSQHLFLVSYRSVLRETHACIEGAVKMQAAYLHRVEIGLSPGDKPDDAGVYATLCLCNAYDMYCYKKEFDEIYINGDYTRLKHFTIAYEDLPATVAVSALFSLDDLEWPNDVARIALNVFPAKGKVHAVFSFLERDSKVAGQFLSRVQSASGYNQRYLISKIILQHCDNIALSPIYFEKMSEEKKRVILEFFGRTIFENNDEYESRHLYLF